MGARPTADRGSVLTVFVLDSTVLIGYLRDLPAVAAGLRQRLSEGHTLATTCVNLAEVEARLLAFERRYEEAAKPFEWKFTRQDLRKLMDRLEGKDLLPAA